VAWAPEGLSQRLIRLRAHSRDWLSRNWIGLPGLVILAVRWVADYGPGVLSGGLGDPEVAFGCGGEGVEGADAVAGGGGQVGAYGAEGPGTGHGAHAAGDLDADLADTRLRQGTWLAIGKHHECITAQPKAGVRMSTLHQRLRDQHGLAVSVQSLRRYVTANVPEETRRADLAQAGAAIPTRRTSCVGMSYRNGLPPSLPEPHPRHRIRLVGSSSQPAPTRAQNRFIRAIQEERRGPIKPAQSRRSGVRSHCALVTDCSLRRVTVDKRYPP